jgi:CubicO group peptidase (beta-lactamase class C family)
MNTIRHWANSPLQYSTHVGRIVSAGRKAILAVKRKRIAALALLLVAVLPASLLADASDSVGPAHSGAWFDPSHNGEGYLLEVLDSERAVVYWFTYDETGEQRWLTGVGEISGNTITVEQLYQPTGPVFGEDFDPADLMLNPSGSATFSFQGCDAGTVQYQIGESEGGLDIIRLSSIAGLDCGGVARPSSALFSGLSGSWYLPARNGEGFVVETIAPDTLLIYWFTYDTEGNQAWYFGIETIVDAQIIISDLFATRGPSFGPDFDPADLELSGWGQLEIDLGCSRLDYRYTSTNFGSGAGEVVRLTQIGQTQCVEAAHLSTQLDSMLSEQPDPDNFEYGASYAASSKIVGVNWSGVAGQSAFMGPPLTADYAFKTGTLGQMYSAALVLRLVEEGELDLDASIAEYLPPEQISGLSVFEGQDHTSQITLRHLLSHRSGLPDLFDQQVQGQQTVLDVLLSDLDRFRTNAELLELARTLMLAESVPGTDLLLSDLNYIVMAEIVEAATGRSLDQNFRQFITEPTGMTETWSISREQAPTGIELAAAHIAETDVTVLPAGRSFDSGNDWASTTADLGRFMDALFGGELFESPATLEEMIDPAGGYIGLAEMGLGLMTRTGDCALPNATLMGYIGDGGFALYIPERQTSVYGFATRLDYSSIGYVDDVLQAMFGPGSCRDSGAWEKAATPESAGFSSSALTELENFLRATDTAAMMAVADGQVVFEYGLTGRRYKSHSIRKTFVSAMYGAEVDAGTIDLDSTMGELGIDDINPLTAQENSATVRHLLQTRSGIYLPAAAAPVSDEFRPPRGSAAPGTQFFYNNWDFNTAGTIYENATGASVYDRFLSTIAAPIGMEDIRRQDQFYIYERLASRHPAYFFTLNARDMARFGQLFLQNGQWQGQQVIDPSWVAESTQSYSDTGNDLAPGFGYMNWYILEDGSYFSSGSGGHKVMVLPTENMVVVLRVDTYNEGARVGTTPFFQAVDLLKAARQ